MKFLAIPALLALASTQADAGDVKVRLGYDSHRGVRIGVGVNTHRHRDHVRRDRHRDRRVDRSHDRRHRHREPVRIHRRHDRHHHRVHHQHRRVWVPGCYVTVTKRVYVPAHYDSVYVPAQYEYRYDACGYRQRYLVRAAYTKKVHVPGHYDLVEQRVWKPGYWR